MPDPEFKKTALAASELQLSQGHLKRQTQEKGGPLLEGVHYIFGPTKNSPIQWDVAACRAEFHRRGMLRRRADKALLEAGVSDKNLTEKG